MLERNDRREKQRVYREKQLLLRNVSNLGFDLSKNVSRATSGCVDRFRPVDQGTRNVVEHVGRVLLETRKERYRVLIRTNALAST